MEFTGNEGGQITLNEAIELTQLYRDTSPLGATKSFAVGENLIYEILSQKECRGLRIYNAKKENGDPTIVIVGVNSLGQDIYNGFIIDRVISCPPLCPDSPLNSNFVKEELIEEIREELLMSWN